MAKKLVLLQREEDKNDIINIVTAEGGKIIHDSGGRIIVVETDGSEEKIRGKLPQGAALVSPEEDARSRFTELDPSESIFLDALNIRSSSNYRTAKRLRKPPGEEPEERKLLSASCTEVE
jgi:hypothetical protein